MSFSIAIIIIIGFALLVFTVWNMITLSRLSRSSERKESLNDSKYFELKYKSEFLVAIFSVIAVAITFFGYNTIRSVEKAMTQEFKSKVDSSNNKIAIVSSQADSLNNNTKVKFKELSNETDKKLAEAESRTQDISHTITKKLSNTEKSVEAYKRQLTILAARQSQINTEYERSNSQAELILKKIENINSKNILKQNFYIVDSLIYTVPWTKSDSVEQKYYFKDLVTSTGDKLPTFTKPPAVISFSSHGLVLSVHKVTKEYFVCYAFNFAEEITEKTRDQPFSVLISQL